MGAGSWLHLSNSAPCSSAALIAARRVSLPFPDSLTPCRIESARIAESPDRSVNTMGRTLDDEFVRFSRAGRLCLLMMFLPQNAWASRESAGYLIWNIKAHAT